MKFVFGVVFCLLSVSAFSAGASEQENETETSKIKEELRQRYHGAWFSDQGGIVEAELQQDGRLLLQTSGPLAEYLLFHLPTAQDSAQYIPSKLGSSWMNYFIRDGDSISCGLSSSDLKLDPFPTFKCRLAIDATGEIKSFKDRPLNTLPDWRQAPLSDFLWRNDPFPLKADGNSYQTSGMPNLNLTHLQVYGDVAVKMWDILVQAKEEDGFMGPIQAKFRIGKQLWCAKMSSPDGFSDDPAKSVKCRIQFDQAGLASSDIK
jgi:hypothetical protein